jgi:hypothetical protein
MHIVRECENFGVLDGAIVKVRGNFMDQLSPKVRLILGQVPHKFEIIIIIVFRKFKIISGVVGINILGAEY